jgi:hypothetical protein
MNGLGPPISAWPPAGSPRFPGRLIRNREIHLALENVHPRDKHAKHVPN